MLKLSSVALVAVFSAVPVSAQRAPSPPTATARGVVNDSLSGGTLRDAFVVVDGAGRGGATDSLGRFTIDSIPPGSYRLVLMHALLDTLGLTVVTPSITFAPGDTIVINLSTPSPETVVRAKCGPGPFPGGSAALIGVVVNSETEAPVEGASVVLAWSEYQAGRETGVRRVARQRVAKTVAGGTFRICGLPPDLIAELFAWTSGDTTGVLPVTFESTTLAVRTLALPGGGAEVVLVDTSGVPSRAARTPRAQTASLRRGRAVVTGSVTTLSGAPVAGARISVSGAVGAAITDDRGRFTLTGQPSGSQTVIVRRLGYELVELPVNLSSRAPRDVAVRLAEFVPVLETVQVQARREDALGRVGFATRQRAGIGRFMTAEEIERRNAFRLVDLLADFPMLRAVSTGGSGRMITGRSRGLSTNCVQYYVDSFPWLGEGAPTDFMLPSEIGAIEAYSATTTPAEFQRASSGCETVVIWTKHKLGMR